jgi:co-chaperonin GroES (HSP10)
MKNGVARDTEKTCPIKVIGKRILLRKLSDSEYEALFGSKREQSLIIIPESIQKSQESHFCYCEVVGIGAQAMDNCRAQGVDIGSIVMINKHRTGDELSVNGSHYIIISEPIYLEMVVEIAKGV